jgi:hypothetical protein
MGKQMEYMALMKDPDLQPLWKIGLAMRPVASSRASMTSQEQTHVSVLNSKTYQRTDTSYMAKLHVTKSLTKK